MVPYINLEYFYYYLYRLLTGDLFSDILAYLEPLLPFLTQAGVLLTLALLVGIIYTLIRLRQIHREEAEKYAVATEDALAEEEITNERWEKVERLIASPEPDRWRLAILEADIILDELVEKMGYHGENLGERLKGVEKSDFNTIDKAWEAHKIRNKIAHEGDQFILTEREARRVIQLFREVFEEFHFI